MHFVCCKIVVKVASLGDFLLSNQGWFNTAALKLLLCQAASFLSSLSQVVRISWPRRLTLIILQLFIMDLFLGRRFFNLGSNIFNYAILREALNEVDPITLVRRIILYSSWLRCSHESSCAQWTPLAWLPPFPRSPDYALCRWTLLTRRSTWSSGSSSWRTLSSPSCRWSGRHIL